MIPAMPAGGPRDRLHMTARTTTDTRATERGTEQTAPLRVLALEPWLGGSHARFLEGWRARSRHVVEVRGLAPRHWKWRMAASAWELARALERGSCARPDVLFASDYLDLPALRGFLPSAWSEVPAVLYFHENQLTYPLRPGATEDDRDHSHGLRNVLSALAARCVAFNSRYHLDAFAVAADDLLARLPRPNPRSELRIALQRAVVVHPGIDLEELPIGQGAEASAPLRVAFNHRWEHDKDPAAFLRAVRDALRLGARMELVLLGETFEQTPDEAVELLEELAPIVHHRGYAASRAEYARRLGECDLVVSTARHDFFGMSVVEGLAAGCMPLLPARLAYPEVLAPELHEAALYTREADLVARLRDWSDRPEALREPAHRDSMRAAAGRHDAARTAAELDRLCSRVHATNQGATMA